PPKYDFDRLRAAFSQVLAGILALHDAGKLHRDIKPTNVLVNRHGRVVILDFGLVSETDGETSISNSRDAIAGTPAYMAPELAMGGQLGPAGDWYSVGVMLYESLVGELPFLGNGIEVLRVKCIRDPQPPHEHNPEIPEDLSQLCMQLLQRHPDDRPDQTRLRQLANHACSASPPPQAAALPPPLSPRNWPLIGRTEHLRRLRRALLDVRPMTPLVVCLHGRSGLGKTALMHQFIEDVHRNGRGVVITGRCYAAESVAFKAFDSLVDALTELLLEQLDPVEPEDSGLFRVTESDLFRVDTSTITRPLLQRALPFAPDDADAFVLPEDIAALARLFPVLRRVQAIDDICERNPLDLEGHPLLRRARAALRELLARLSSRKPFVLFIDDLQWGDTDSASLLIEVLRGPRAPGVLVVLGYRSEDVATSPILEQLPIQLREEKGMPEVREVEVGPLTLEEAKLLASAGLDPDAHDGSRRPQEIAAQIDLIAQESHGSPLFVRELVHHVEAARATVDSPSTASTLELGQVSLDDVTRERLDRLPDTAQEVMNLVAVAGNPIEQVVLSRVLNNPSQARSGLALLRSQHLVRKGAVDRGNAVEVYHDAIGEQVLARLSPEHLRKLHRQLADALSTTGDVKPELLAFHLRGAGDRERAARFTIDAASKATASLAFNRAVELYATAIELTSTREVDTRRALQVLRGQALVYAGRAHEAARVFLEASATASPQRALTLQRRAGEQLLRCGEFHHGMAVLDAVLAKMGFTTPRTKAGVIGRTLRDRVVLRVRGFNFQPRAAVTLAPEEIEELDTVNAARAGLSMLDPMRSNMFASLYVRRCLEVGEPSRVVGALSMEAAQLSFQGAPTYDRVQRLLQAARMIADEHQCGAASDLNFVKGAVAFFNGHFSEALKRIEATQKSEQRGTLGDEVEGPYREMFELLSLYHMGRFNELRARKREHLQHARERANLCAETTVRAGPQVATWLIEDKPAKAGSDLQNAVRRWPEGSFIGQRCWAFLGARAADMYLGDGNYAWARAEEAWPQYRTSFMFLGQFPRIMGRYWRATAALAYRLDGGPKRKRVERIAQREANAIASEKIAWGQPYADLIHAGLCEIAGETQQAIEKFKTAAAGFEAGEMAAMAASARYRLGAALGGDEGHRLKHNSERALLNEGVVRPDRLIYMY
ncbi:MAG: ATP-binding protein, partial [Nannocystaceae bacterium]